MESNQRSVSRVPYRQTTKSNRLMFNVVLWIARIGAAWQDTGLLESLFITLNCEADYENLSIDLTVVTAHQQSADEKKEAKFCHFATHRQKQWWTYGLMRTLIKGPTPFHLKKHEKNLSMLRLFFY